MENQHLLNIITRDSGANVSTVQSLTVEELQQGFDKLMIDIDYLYDKLQLDKLFKCIQSVFHQESKDKLERDSNKLNVDLFYGIKSSLDDSNEEKVNSEGILNQRTKLKQMLKDLHELVQTHWVLYDVDDKQLTETLKEVYERFEVYNAGPEERGGSVFTRSRNDSMVIPMLSSIYYELYNKNQEIDPFKKPSKVLSSKIKTTMIDLYGKVNDFTEKRFVTGINVVEDNDLMFLQQNQGMIDFRINATTYLFMFQQILYRLVHMLVNSIPEMISNLKDISSGIELTTLTQGIGKVVLINEIFTVHDDKIDLKNPIIHKFRNVINSILHKTRRVSMDTLSQKSNIARIARERGVDKEKTNIQYSQAVMPIEFEGWDTSGSYESSISSGSLDEDFLKGVLGDLDSEIDVDTVMEDVGPVRLEGRRRRKTPNKKVTMYRGPTKDDLVPSLSNTYGIQRIRPIEPHMDYAPLRTYVEIDGNNGNKLNGYVIGEEKVDGRETGRYIIGIDGFRAKVKLFDIWKVLFPTNMSLDSVEIEDDLLEYMDIRDNKLEENKDLNSRLLNNIRKITRGNKLLMEIMSEGDHLWRKPLQEPYLSHADGDYYLLGTVHNSINNSQLPHYFIPGYWGGNEKLEDIEVLIYYDDKIVTLNRSEFRVAQGQHMDMVSRQFNQDRDEGIQELYQTYGRIMDQEDRLAENSIRTLNRDNRLARNLHETTAQLRGLQFESQVPEYERQRALATTEGYLGGGSTLKDCCDKNIKTRRKCRRKDGKKFKLPRKHSRKTCLSKKKKGFSMRSSCAPFKYCDQSGGGTLFSRETSKIYPNYESSDWSQQSDSIEGYGYPFVDPYGPGRLYSDSGDSGGKQWFQKYGSQLKDNFRIYEGEQEVCKLPHKGNSKKLKKWMKRRGIKKTKKFSGLTEKEIYGNVSRKDELFDYMECKNGKYLDIVCKDGKLTETKCVKSNTGRGGGKTTKKPIKTTKKPIKTQKKKIWKPEKVIFRQNPQGKIMTDAEIVKMGVKDMDDYTKKTKGKKPSWSPKKEGNVNKMLFDLNFIDEKSVVV